MAVVVATLYLVCGISLLLALTLLARARRLELEQRIASRFSALTGTALGRQPRRSTWYLRQLHRAGISARPRYAVLAGLVLILLMALAGYLAGAGAALGTGLLYGLAVYSLVQFLYKRRVDRITAQLPMFVDHVIRALHTGASLEMAIGIAAEQTPPPLKHVTDRIQRAVELGDSLSDALDETAQMYNIRYLYILTMGARVNARFGSSAIGLFKSLQQMIQQRERASRELRALTGETRLSALVLGVLPVGLAGYILATNPAYLGTMWDDPGGRTAMLLALGWQALGMLIIWRMIRNI